MDGTLAFIFLIVSLTDMAVDYCPSGCVQQNGKQAYITLGAQDLRFEGASISQEAFVSYRMAQSYGPFQPTVAASVAANGASWVGFGATWEKTFGDLVLTTSLLPGYYNKGRSGPDLGFPLEFRSSIGAGYNFDNGMRLSVTYDHRSNAELGKINPGLETYGLQLSIPFN